MEEKPVFSKGDLEALAASARPQKHRQILKLEQNSDVIYFKSEDHQRREESILSRPKQKDHSSVVPHKKVMPKSPC